jgi:hypothetical protein
MGRTNNSWSTILTLGFVALLLPGQLFAAQQKSNDDKLKIGNGAILRRLFGDAESNKQKMEKARTAQKETFDATRQRLASETERLKEKLGFKQPAEKEEPRDEEPTIAERNPVRNSSTVEPRSQFAPQAPNRLSISDQARNRTPATPAAAIVRPPAQPLNTQGRAAPNRPATNPPSANQVPRLVISDDAPAPRNQPRVPSQPTFVSPPAGTTATNSSTLEVEDPKPTPATFGAFGIIVDAKASGLLIKAIKPKSVAATIGLRPGDQITNVAGLDVTAVEEIDSLVEVLEPEDEFEITFYRDGKTQTETFSIPKQ